MKSDKTFKHYLYVNIYVFSENNSKIKVVPGIRDNKMTQPTQTFVSQRAHMEINTLNQTLLMSQYFFNTVAGLIQKPTFTPFLKFRAIKTTAFGVLGPWFNNLLIIL